MPLPIFPARHETNGGGGGGGGEGRGGKRETKGDQGRSCMQLRPGGPTDIT